MSAVARRGVVIPADRRWPGWLIALCQAALLLAVVAVWELGVRTRRIDPFFWSSPSKIWETAVIFLRAGDAVTNTWFTFRATLIGFVLGTTAGAVIGLALWWSRNLAAILEPFVIVFNAVPKLAFAPLLILLFGIGISSKIALAAALTVVIAILAALSGVKAVDSDLIRLLYSLGASRWQVFTKVVVPSSLPWIISSLRINIGLALTGAIVGEFVSSQFGLGKVIMYAGSTYEMGLIWVGIAILSALAIAMYLGVLKLEQIMLRGMHAGQNQ